MLPILATIGTSLAWFAGAAGQLIFWGVGITIGFWVGKKITGVFDNFGANTLGKLSFRKFSREAPQAA